MMLRFSFKLLFTNFSTIWKVLLYYTAITLLIIGLIFLLVVPTFKDIIEKILNTEIIYNAAKLVGAPFTESDIPSSDYLQKITDDLSEIGSIFSDNSKEVAYLITMSIVIILIGYFLYGLVNVPAADVLNMNMSSQARPSFMGIFFSKFGLSCKFTLARMLIYVPFDFAIFAGTIGLLFLVGKMGLFALMLASLYMVAGNAFKISLFSGWLPALVTDKLNVFEALRTGSKYAYKRFWEIFSTAVIFIYLYMIAAVILGIITFGASLIIIVPIKTVVLCLFYLVMYYGATARKYYVDYDTIITPRTLRDKNAELLYRLNEESYRNMTGILDKNLIDNVIDDDKIITKVVDVRNEFKD